MKNDNHFGLLFIQIFPKPANFLQPNRTFKQIICSLGYFCCKIESFNQKGNCQCLLLFNRNQKKKFKFYNNFK